MEQYIGYVIFLPGLNKNFSPSKYVDAFNCLGADSTTQAGRYYVDICFFV